MKPHPKVFLRTLRDLNAPAESAAIVGTASRTSRPVWPPTSVAARRLAAFEHTSEGCVVDGILYLRTATFVTGEILRIDAGQVAGY
jgi:hypothetical protein